MSIQFASATPQFSVPDVVQTARYYERVLGFTILGYWDGERIHHDDERPVSFCILQRDNVRLHFHRADQEHAGAGRSGGGYDVYFHVKGVDELVDELRDRDAEILDGAEDRIYGQREVVVRDCNGLILAFGDESGG